jgi:hypothetical protein
MGTGRYYLSQSTSNEGRKHAKGLHVAIWEFYSGEKVQKGDIIHHKDGNYFNNDYSNLERITRREHLALHAEKNRGKKPSKEQLEHLSRVREKATLWHRSEAGRAWHREHAKTSLGKIKKEKYCCSFCKKDFESKIKLRKVERRFCSSKCYTKWQWRNNFEIIRKKCVICYKEFDARASRHARITCSDECRAKLRMQNIRLKSL